MTAGTHAGTSATRGCPPPPECRTKVQVVGVVQNKWVSGFVAGGKSASRPREPLRADLSGGSFLVTGEGVRFVACRWLWEPRRATTHGMFDPPPFPYFLRRRFLGQTLASTTKFSVGRVTAGAIPWDAAPIPPPRSPSSHSGGAPASTGSSAPQAPRTRGSAPSCPRSCRAASLCVQPPGVDGLRGGGSARSAKWNLGDRTHI